MATSSLSDRVDRICLSGQVWRRRSISGGFGLSRSLSVLLHVSNREALLERLVNQVLDVAHDLTPALDVLIIDDGSTDESLDTAYDLAHRYPQVGVVRPRGRGLEAALAAGLDAARGNTILFRGDHCRFGLDDLSKLWSAIDEFDVVVAAERRMVEDGLFARMRRALQNEKATGTRFPELCLMRRSAAEQLVSRPEDSAVFWTRLELSGFRYGFMVLTPVTPMLATRTGVRPSRPHLPRSSAPRAAGGMHRTRTH